MKVLAIAHNYGNIVKHVGGVLNGDSVGELFFQKRLKYLKYRKDKKHNFNGVL